MRRHGLKVLEQAQIAGVLIMWMVILIAVPVFAGTAVGTYLRPAENVMEAGRAQTVKNPINRVNTWESNRDPDRRYYSVGDNSLR